MAYVQCFIAANAPSQSGSCSFPSWLQSSNWLDFNVQSLYKFNRSQLLMNRYKDHQDTGRSTHRLQCLEAERPPNNSDVIMLVHTVHRW